MIMALAPLALDTYLPAFPDIASSLAVDMHDISLSISVYVFVLALGQLVGGPLSDRLGRMPVMLAGLAVFGLASILLSASQSLATFLPLRGLQAFGGGCAAVCIPALVRDRLSGQEAARFFSLIGMIMVVAPAIAPGIGSLLLAQFGWRSIFIFLALYTLLMLVLARFAVFGGRSAGPGGRPPPSPLSALGRYKAVLATRGALRFMALQALSFSVMMLFITHSSFIYQVHFGASPGLFAALFGANVVLMLAMNLINRHLLKSFAATTILRGGLSLQAAGLGLLLLVTLLAPHIWLFVPAMVITIGAMGAITANTQACFMDYFHSNGGTASALLGATQFSVAGLISAASAFLPDSVLAIVLAQAGCSFLCLLLIWTQRE